jgi:hypothetical protein
LSHECDIDEVFMTLLFPRLEVRVETFPKGRTQASQRVMRLAENFGDSVDMVVDIKVYKPVSNSCLFGQIMRTPMRRATWEYEDVLDDFPRSSNQPRTVCDGHLLPLPLSVRNLVFNTTAYLYDDGKMDIEALPLAAPPSRRSPFNWRMYNDQIRLKRQDLHSSGALSVNPGNEIPARHIINSLFETLKVAAWCTVALKDRPNSGEGSSIWVGPLYEDDDIPEIAIELMNHELSHLIEHVSRDHNTHLPARLTHCSFSNLDSSQILSRNTLMFCGAD